MPCDVGVIKDLAWNVASELSSANGKIVKKQYNKTGLKTFYLAATYTKDSFEDTWTSNSTEESNFILADGCILLTKEGLIFKVRES